jgi:hypothetical protein
MEEASCKMKIMRDYRINLNSIFGEKETFKQKKPSHAKHEQRNPAWWEKATQKSVIGRKMGGDGQEYLGK